MRLLEAGESNEIDVDRTVRSRRRRVLRVWIWTMVIALVGILAVLAFGALFWADFRAGIFRNESPPLSDEARSRLEQIQSSSGFAATPAGATETESLMSDHSCFDWFDGGEPRVQRTLSASDVNAVAIRLERALRRDGWAGNIRPGVVEPTVVRGAFTRPFGDWLGSVVLMTDPVAHTIVISGAVAESAYCSPAYIT